MQSLVCSLVLALLALWPAPIVSAAQEISIRPGSGREMDTFMVRGYGLPAGVAVDVRLFSPEERVYRLTGVGGLIVGPDGKPRDIRVARSLGLGLDEKAIQAVNQWKFEPALKDGRPVAVQIAVEVQFRLY